MPTAPEKPKKPARRDPPTPLAPKRKRGVASDGAGLAVPRAAGRELAAPATRPRRSPRADGRETRARVLGAAAEIFARDGFEGASLRQIAERAGIDIATLKYHVQDKAALFAEVYQDGYEHFRDALGPLLMRLPLAQDRDALVRELEAVLERGYDYLDEHQVFVRLWLFRLLETSSQVRDVEETLRTNVIGLIEAAVEVLRRQGLVRRDVDVRMVVLLIVTGLPTLALGVRARPGWLGDSELSPRARFIHFFRELLRSYLLPAAGA